MRRRYTPVLSGLAVVLLAELLILPCHPAIAKITRSGTIHTVIADNFAQGEATTTYYLSANGERTPVLPTTPISASSGDRVTVSGTMEDGYLVGSIAATSPTAELLPAGPRKVAVVMIRFPGDPEEPWTAEQVRERVFTAPSSVNAFYQEESYGKISLTGKLNPDGDVFGWFTLEPGPGDCPRQLWKKGAENAASEAGISLSGYDHLIFLWPRKTPCMWGGLSEGVPNATSYINGAMTSSRTFIHELGHNFGLRHAGSWSCTGPSGYYHVTISDSCTADTYGDVFDVMGFSTRHNNGFNLAKLGVLALGNVQTITTSGTYGIKAALDPTSEPTTLRIPRARDAGGAVTSWYYLEVRQAGGVFEPNDASTTGVSIRATQRGGSIAPETVLIDANPAYPPSFNDAPFAVGQTFDDGAVRVRTLAAGGGGATVAIDFLPPPDSEPPNSPANLSAQPGSSGVELAWGPSTDNVGVARYVLLRDGVEIATTPGITFLDTTAPLGAHAYVVIAEDEAGNQSPPSAPALATVPDSVRAMAADTRGLRRPRLRWRYLQSRAWIFRVDATDDPVAASIGLWIDGQRLGLENGPSLQITWGPRGTGLCNETHRIVGRVFGISGETRIRVAHLRLRTTERSGGCMSTLGALSLSNQQALTIESGER